MSNSLKSIFIISVLSFILLELGFYLEGFLQFILFSLVTVIYFVLLFLFYGFLHDKEKDKSKTFIFIVLVMIPLISAFFNPTFYLHGVSDNNIVLVATQHAEGTLQNSSSITLLKDSTYRLKEYGFWMNTEEDGKYEIKNNKIILELPDYKFVFRMKNIHKQKKVCAVKNRKINYKNCYEIDKIDNQFIKEISSKK